MTLADLALLLRRAYDEVRGRTPPTRLDPEADAWWLDAARMHAGDPRETVRAAAAQGVLDAAADAVGGHAPPAATRAVGPLLGGDGADLAELDLAEEEQLRLVVVDKARAVLAGLLPKLPLPEA